MIICIRREKNLPLQIKEQEGASEIFYQLFNKMPLLKEGYDL